MKEKIIAEDGWCPVCKCGTETGITYCEKHQPKDWFHFSEWFDRNFIYCEQTHSFTHRFYDELKKNMPEDYKGAQNIAWTIFTSMQKEFFDGKPAQTEENKNGIL